MALKNTLSRKYRVVCIGPSREMAYPFRELDLGRPIRVTKQTPKPDLSPAYGGSPFPIWQIFALIPSVTFLAAFVKGFGDKLGGQAAEAAGNACTSWLRRMRAQRNAKHVEIIVWDVEKDLRIYLPKDAPPEAYYELLDLLSKRWPVFATIAVREKQPTTESMPEEQQAQDEMAGNQLTLDNMPERQSILENAPETNVKEITGTELHYTPERGWQFY